MIIKYIGHTFKSLDSVENDNRNYRSKRFQQSTFRLKLEKFYPESGGFLWLHSPRLCDEFDIIQEKDKLLWEYRPEWNTCYSTYRSFEPTSWSEVDRNRGIWAFVVGRSGVFPR